MSIKVSQNWIFYEFPNKLIYQRRGEGGGRGGEGGGEGANSIMPLTPLELMQNYY